MRKNLLVAALVGLCIVGMSACSRGEDNQQPADNMTQADATAATQPAVTNSQNPAPAPAAPAANNAAPTQPAAPAAPANTDAQPQNNTMDNMAPPAAKLAPSANDDTTSAQ